MNLFRKKTPDERIALLVAKMLERDFHEKSPNLRIMDFQVSRILDAGSALSFEIRIAAIGRPR